MEIFSLEVESSKGCNIDTTIKVVKDQSSTNVYRPTTFIGSNNNLYFIESVSTNVPFSTFEIREKFVISNHSNLQILRNIPHTYSLIDLFKNDLNDNKSSKLPTNVNKNNSKYDFNFQNIRFSSRHVNSTKNNVKCNRQYSKKEKERILAFCRDNSNVSVTALARQTGVSLGTIRKWLNKFGMKRTFKKHADDDKEQTVKLHRQGNKSRRKEAKKIVIPQETESNWIHEEVPQRSKTRKSKYSAEFKEQVLKLCHQDDLTREEVAEKFGVPLGTVSTWAYKEQLKNKLMKSQSEVEKRKQRKF